MEIEKLKLQADSSDNRWKLKSYFWENRDKLIGKTIGDYKITVISKTRMDVKSLRDGKITRISWIQLAKRLNPNSFEQLLIKEFLELV